MVAENLGLNEVVPGVAREVSDRQCSEYERFITLKNAVLAFAARDQGIPLSQCESWYKGVSIGFGLAIMAIAAGDFDISEEFTEAVSQAKACGPGTDVRDE